MCVCAQCVALCFHVSHSASTTGAADQGQTWLFTKDSRTMGNAAGFLNTLNYVSAVRPRLPIVLKSMSRIANRRADDADRLDKLGFTSGAGTSRDGGH